MPFDKVLIEQVLVNLIENAILYTPPETAIEISASLEEDNILVSVADHGAGLMLADIDKIFEKFYRGETPKKRRGSGLGLSVCQSIIRAHGGKIWAENSWDGGAVFHLCCHCIYKYLGSVMNQDNQVMQEQRNLTTELVYFLYNQARATIAGSFVISSCLVYGLYFVAPERILFSWYVFMLATMLLRYYLVKAYMKVRSVAQHNGLWRNLFVLSVLFTAIRKHGNSFLQLTWFS